MLPEFPATRPLSAEDNALFAKRLAKLPGNICEQSFASLFIWQDWDKPQLTQINENLCVLMTPPNNPPYFLEPFGRNRPLLTAEICLRDNRTISRASRSFVDLLPGQKFFFTALRDQADYVYERKQLAVLAGKKFDGKRNQIKHFLSRCKGHQLIPFTAEHRLAAMQLFERWFVEKKVRAKDKRYVSRFAYHALKGALVLALENFKLLQLFGSALFVKDELKGFILGSRLNPQSVVVHFQYADFDCPGTYQYLLREACRTSFTEYRYINLEEDEGVAGMRKTKLSYDPLRLEEKFEITYR